MATIEECGMRYTLDTGSAETGGPYNAPMNAARAFVIFEACQLNVLKVGRLRVASFF